jgi:hypothetical protein
MARAFDLAGITNTVGGGWPTLSGLYSVRQNNLGCPILWD